MEKYPGLPKWPAFYVKGKSVNSDLASEIIIRTSRFQYYCTNNKQLDSEFENQLFDLCGFKKDSTGTWKGYEKDILKKWEKYPEACKLISQKLSEYKVNFFHEYNMSDVFCILVKSLLTEYSEINSDSAFRTSYIGGPGSNWIKLNGDINLTSMNLGKYPDSKEIYKDFCRIAKEWPTLDFIVKLMPLESSEYLNINLTSNDKKLIPIFYLKIKDGNCEILPNKKGKVKPGDFTDANIEELIKIRLAKGSHIEYAISPSEMIKKIEKVINKVWQ